MRIVLILALVCRLGIANSYDIDIRDSVVWENTELPAAISDVTVSLSVIAPLLLARRSWESAGIVVGALVSNALITGFVKKLADRGRPNGEHHSFFSGHTSTAFTGAGLVCLQSRDWKCTVSLAIAGLTGYLRMAADKHWFSDVLVGATFGIVQGRFVPALVFQF